MEPCSPFRCASHLFSCNFLFILSPTALGGGNLISGTSAFSGAVCVLGSSHSAKRLAGRSHGASVGILLLGHQFSVLGRTSLIPSRNPFRSGYSFSFPVLLMKAHFMPCRGWRIFPDGTANRLTTEFFIHLPSPRMALPTDGTNGHRGSYSRHPSRLVLTQSPCFSLKSISFWKCMSRQPFIVPAS